MSHATSASRPRLICLGLSALDATWTVDARGECMIVNFRSAIQPVDPDCTFPAARQRLPAHTGLVVTLEDHRFRDMPGGRLSHSIADWSVEKIKRAGG